MIGSVVSEDAWYLRPGSERVNRLLPPAPFTVKTSGLYLSLIEDVFLRALGGVSAMVAGVIVFLATAASLWTIKAGALLPYFDPEEVDLLLRKGWGFISAVLVVSGLLLVVGAVWWSKDLRGRFLATQHRFIAGAERWNWSQRFRALAIYAVWSPWSFVVPLLAIPLRLLHGCVAMSTYLLAARENHVATANGAAAVYAEATVRVLTLLAGATALYVALTVTIPSI